MTSRSLRGSFERSAPRRRETNTTDQASPSALICDPRSGTYDHADRASTTRITDTEVPTYIELLSVPCEQNASSPSLSSRQSPDSRWRSVSTTSHISPGTDRYSHLRQLMLHWEKDSSNRVVLKSVETQERVEAANCISWQCDHSQSDDSLHLAHRWQTCSM